MPHNCSPTQKKFEPLPPHTVRISARARRISLRMLPGKGLEVVLPQNADPSCVPSLLARYKNWIERAAGRMGAGSDGGEIPLFFMVKGESECVVPVWGGEVPQDLTGPEYRAPGKRPVPVRHISLRGQAASTNRGQTASTKKDAPDNRSGQGGQGGQNEPDEGQERRFLQLRAWVRKEAKLWLEPMLQELAQECGLEYSSVSVRFQKSRWGSCSVRKSINLNACLLFLPERLVRYILLHELCHTKEMNHGPGFWKLVFAADPAALQKDKAMRGAWKFVPDWIFL